MGKRWNPVEGRGAEVAGHDSRSKAYSPPLRPCPPPFSLFKTLEVLESQAAVLRKELAGSLFGLISGEFGRSAS